MFVRLQKSTKALLSLLAMLTGSPNLFALGQTNYVSTNFVVGSFELVKGKSVADILVDTNDFPGVIRAAGDLQKDIKRVTGRTAAILNPSTKTTNRTVIIGTIGRSKLIDQLVIDKTIDISGIKGKWESTLIQKVKNPSPGIADALVICGSDKRGTIYGIYDLSEQIGVSPWYFFADVPAQHKDELYIPVARIEYGPPTVQYRGIFINDEAPDLTEWVKQNYGNYNHGFYTNVFELLLRLKANYLWPAMWDNCFNEDDPLNPKLADEYGIVMGTSHVEPMMRADKEWMHAGYKPSQWHYESSPKELSDFWRAGIERNKDYENIVTIAMRGKVDTAMSRTANINLLETIVAEQRRLITEVYHTNAAAVPQLWALYKEVQEYYEKGMRVPDDVTLLWCDDNWGNLRKLPAASERSRSGGAGIYYHVDYVGSPRNYKWVNSSPLPRIWEQMNLAHEHGANRIWIVNVGHLQHVQLPMEFFLSQARNPEAFGPDSPAKFTRDWAQREFGATYAAEIADVVATFTKYNGRRKPELLSPSTFSLVNYGEADRVVQDWVTLRTKAEEISSKLPANTRDAFFELVLYPVKACCVVNQLYVTAAKNHLYAAQGRASANALAEEAKHLFDEDAQLSAYYNHTLANGKWNHMMDQTHIGYTRWQQPDKNNLPDLATLDVPEESQMALAVEGSTNFWTIKTGSNAALPGFDKFTGASRYLDIFNRGKKPFNFTAKPSSPWILLNQTNGTVDSELRLTCNIDWKNAPPENSTGSITILDDHGNSIKVLVTAFNPPQPSVNALEGFVETGGLVSIEAEHFTKNVSTADVAWKKVPDLGATLSGMTTFPVTTSSTMPPEPSACLEYKMYLFDPHEVRVESILSPTLNFISGQALRYALSFDDQPPQIVTAVPENYAVGDAGNDWQRSVSDSVRKVKTNFTLSGTGYHTLKFWRMDAGVVLQKLVVDLGGVKPSYLGPPESFHR